MASLLTTAPDATRRRGAADVRGAEGYAVAVAVAVTGALLRPWTYLCLLRRGGPGAVGPLSIRHESLRRRGGPGAVGTSTPVGPHESGDGS